MLFVRLLLIVDELWASCPFLTKSVLYADIVFEPMFTGIVQGIARVVRIEQKEGARTFELELGRLAEGLQHGASVSVAGVCLTAVTQDEARVQFDVIGETLAKTALGSLEVGDEVNIERSAKLGDEIGGHLVSGHVAATLQIRAIDRPVNNWIVTLACPPEWLRYILPKGFVALDGCSLTIVDVGADFFTVHLIPETLMRTTFGKKQVGAEVHLEIDPMTRAIVDTVTRLTSSL